MSADTYNYELWKERASEAWEAQCNNCGACCGAYDGDPCANLRKKSDGLYYCADYENRLGPQKTVSGRSFHCLPIRVILHQSWPGDFRCSYKQPPQGPTALP